MCAIKIQEANYLLMLRIKWLQHLSVAGTKDLLTQELLWATILGTAQLGGSGSETKESMFKFCPNAGISRPC